jgi:hypothetical protein
MAAPWIIFGTINQASPEGIQMNIANQLQKIGISVTNNGLIASLKEMPYPIISPVKIQGIPGMKSLQNL